MKKWLIRILAGTALLLVAAVVAGWWLLRASLPPLDGRIEVAGLSKPATIVRDADGIPTITAADRRDLAFATGFAHGQDRFFQMDLIRRRAAGELSELVGAAAVDADRNYRLHRFRARADAVLGAAPRTDVELLESYAAGVNAGLASLDARPFEYLLLGAKPRPWQPQDSILVVYSMYVQLNDARANDDVRRGYARRALPPDVFEWLYPAGTRWDAPIVGEAIAERPLPGPDEYSIRDVRDHAPPAAEVGKPYLNGSNNWAVGGALTPTGRALVSNDMHLGHGVPNIWYQARLVVTGDEASDESRHQPHDKPREEPRDEPRDVVGVSLPGTPFIVAGSNGSVAWGFTNSYGDWSDAVLLRPGVRPGTYRTPGGERRFETHREVIAVRGAAPVDYEVRETVWGPVDDQASYPDGEVAVRWIAHSPESVNLRLIELETAGSVAAALDIAATMGIPPQNFVAGDAGGNIGWTIAGQIPVRADFDPSVPADWSATDGWLGWLHPDGYPRVINPPGGRIWSANARVIDGEALEAIGDGGYDLGARASQIRDALFAADTFEPGDMLAIQYDDRALFLARWRELLLDVLDPELVESDPELAEYRRLVAAWLPRAAPESVGYRLVRGFRLEVQAKVFHGLTAPVRQANGPGSDPLLSNQFESVLWAVLRDRPRHLLPGPYESWDELLVAAVRQNIAWLRERYPGELAERRWGELNTASIRHPLSRVIPQLAGWLDMPAEPLNGDVDLPKAQGPAFGASQRFSVSPGDEANGLMQMPAGQSGHPLSGFYRAGHEDWVHGRPSPFLPGHAAHELRLQPAG